MIMPESGYFACERFVFTMGILVWKVSQIPISKHLTTLAVHDGIHHDFVRVCVSKWLKEHLPQTNI